MKGRTMTTRTIVPLFAICAVLALGAGIAFGGGDPQTANCPSGQTLSVAKVNGDTFKQGELPDGSHVTDTVSGSGLDYTLQSGADRATLTVKGGTGTLTIECR